MNAIVAFFAENHMRIFYIPSVIMAIILVVQHVVQRVVQLKITKREPLEEFAIVFEIKQGHSKSDLWVKEAKLGYDLELVVEVPRFLGTEHFGEITRIEPGIIEARGMGRMYKGRMWMQIVTPGIKAGDTRRITYVISAPLRANAIKAKVLEVRPIYLASQIWPTAVH